MLALQRQVGNRATTALLQRAIQMRDVGSGEASGFGRVGELVRRIDGMCPSLEVTLGPDNFLAARQTVEGRLSFFESELVRLIGLRAEIPFRLTNRRGRLGSHATGFHDRVMVDDFRSGYVDVDDLLAADDAGLQSELVHFLNERAATGNYARRIGSDNFSDAEFNRGHARGIVAETRLMQDFFGDTSIRFIREPHEGPFLRVFRNSRGDIIRHRFTRGRGEELNVDRLSVEVRTRDGRTMTADEYRALRERERAAAQVPAP